MRRLYSSTEVHVHNKWAKSGGSNKWGKEQGGNELVA